MMGSGSARPICATRFGSAFRVLGAFLALLLPGLSLHAQSEPSHFVVRLRRAPALAQEQGARALLLSGADEAPTSRAARMKAYLTELRDEHATVRGWLLARGSGIVLAETELASNTLIVQMSAQDAAALRQQPDVAEVIPEILYHKAMDAALQLIHAPEAWAARTGGEANAGAGVKIGVIDTGFDITHPMLQDPTLVAPPGFPKFSLSVDAICFSDDQKYTNSKVIVARNYVRLLPSRDGNCDALDRDGHGTFSSTVAAGRRVAAPVASIAGVAPRAYLGNYKVFGTPGSNNNASLGAVLAALDDAVRDGMDVINLSLGADLGLPASADPLAQAVRTAVNAGVIVVVAAGNDGPGSGTVTSPGIAPEAITVGSSSNSRSLALAVEISAGAAVPANLQRLPANAGAGVAITAPVGPLLIRDVLSLAGDGSGCSAIASGALQGSAALIERGGCTFQVKVTNARAAGASAVILFNNQPGQAASGFTPGTATQIPSVMLGHAEGLALRSFVQANGGVSARIGAALQTFPVESNQVASFSSVGPTSDFVIKPDLVAPGVNIYSGVQTNFTAGQQYDASGFGVSQGTSVSAPMVAGAAAIIRQLWPQFTPAQVKSALINNPANTTLQAPPDSLPGVMTWGGGLLDVAAAATTPAVIVPSSISLGAAPRGTAFSRAFQFTVTNTGAASDTFVFSNPLIPGSNAVGASFNPPSLTIAAGASAPVTITLEIPATQAGLLDARIEVRSQATGRTLRVPYWGNFLSPQLNLTGVVNAASFTAGSARLAPGSLVSIFGSQLSVYTGAARFLPLPTSLGGVRVMINDVEAPLLFVSPNQINAQVPYEVANTSLGLLRVVAYGKTTIAVPFEIALAAPGIFTLNQTGRGRGAVLHGASGAAVSEADPARPGEVLSVFVSGLGTTSPAATSGAAATSAPLQTTTRAVTASIGGLSASVSFSGLAPGFAGLYQVNLQVPDGIAPGEQTLLLNSADTLSNPVTISVLR